MDHASQEYSLEEKSSGKAWQLYGLLTLVLVAQALLLYTPASGDPSAPHLDKVVHAVMFGVPAAALTWKNQRWLPVVVLLVHAPASEFIQDRWIASRSGSWADLTADVVGVFIGVLITRFLSNRSRW